MSQVKSGFRAAGGWLLGIVWLGLVFGGLGVAFTPSQYPPAMGWALLAIAAAIFVATANRWVKALPGIFGVASFNSLVTIGTGRD